ncbi:MAG TPA: hypothetical protein VFV80_06705, partial [Geminicoccaceae bacterium]|nr:hypothetical protein [Geminicoccaceae bacterium]
QADLEAQREQLEARLAEATAAKEALDGELAQARQAAETEARSRRKLEREHSSALVKLEARERDLTRLATEREPGQGEIASLPAAERAPKSPGEAPVSGSFVRHK